MTDVDVRDALQALILAGELEEAVEVARARDIYGKRCMWCLAEAFDNRASVWLCPTCTDDPRIYNRVVRTTVFDDGTFFQIGPPILVENPLASPRVLVASPAVPRAPCIVRTVPFVAAPMTLDPGDETK